MVRLATGRGDLECEQDLWLFKDAIQEYHQALTTRWGRVSPPVKFLSYALYKACKYILWLGGEPCLVDPRAVLSNYKVEYLLMRGGTQLPLKSWGMYQSQACILSYLSFH